MKKLTTIILFALLSSGLFAQAYTNGWSVGGGIHSVRLTTEAWAEQLDFGGNIYAQYDLSMRHALRGKLAYSNLNSRLPDVTTNLVTVGVDYLFKFNFEAPVYPYFGAGFSVLNYGVTGGREDGSFGDIEATLLFGALFDVIGDKLKLKGEFLQHTTSTDYMDGLIGNGGGLFGGSMDSYIEFGIGLHYYLDGGEEIKESTLPGGIVEVDYERIDNINKKYAAEKVEPKIKMLEDRIDQLTTQVDDLSKKLDKKTDVTVVPQHFNNVYFKFNSTDPIFSSMNDLVEAAAIVAQTGMKVELVGNTDNSGSDKYNNDLSKKRAEFVKDFMVKRGVDAGNITIKYEGSKTPLADNGSADGRSLNRRVEIKVVK